MHIAWQPTFCLFKILSLYTFYRTRDILLNPRLDIVKDAFLKVPTWVWTLPEYPRYLVTSQSCTWCSLLSNAWLSWSCMLLFVRPFHLLTLPVCGPVDHVCREVEKKNKQKKKLRELMRIKQHISVWQRCRFRCRYESKNTLCRRVALNLKAGRCFISSLSFSL